MELFILTIMLLIITIVGHVAHKNGKKGINYLFYTIIISISLLFINASFPGCNKNSENIPIVDNTGNGNGDGINDNDTTFRYLNDEFSTTQLEPSWQMYNPTLVDINLNNGFLHIIPKTESVWYKEDEGFSIYKNINGNIALLTKVHTRKNSDTTKYPDAQWQFGGIMLRNPTTEKENYVFLVIGHRGDELQVEVKSTTNDVSDVEGFDWPTGDAELMILRKGTLFSLYARNDSSEQWQLKKEYDRPDLPQDLQASVVAYAYSYGRNIFDLLVKFDYVRFQKVLSQ